MHAPDDLLLARLRAMTEAEIAALPGVGEGLERRVRRLAGAAPSREALLDALKCKRYTRARLSRLLVHALLGVTEALVQRHPLPEYARLIGLREDARPLMGELSRRARLPIVANPTKLAGNEVFALECRATDLRALLCDRPDERKAHQEIHAQVRARVTVGREKRLLHPQKAPSAASWQRPAFCFRLPVRFRQNGASSVSQKRAIAPSAAVRRKAPDSRDRGSSQMP